MAANVDAWLAVHKLGLGARPGELESVAKDPRGWLVEQLESPSSSAEPALVDLPSHGVLMAEGQQQAQLSKETHRRWRREVYRTEATARLSTAVTTQRPFRERWTRFWSNHLCVSASKKSILPTVGAFEREVVRRHDTGRFSELVRASTRHPAMLTYLDNQRSIGPDSPYGQRKGKGLNENLARELLELHTLGVDGGYSQHDVIALAQMLTGWSVKVVKNGDTTVSHDAFSFGKRRHQPGPKRLLDTAYPSAGVREAEAAIDVLAQHPSTARHLATKLARHFIADDPPSEVVDILESTWRATGGDLKMVGQTLVAEPRVWAALNHENARKLRTPEELVIAIGRAAGLKADQAQDAEQLHELVLKCAWLGQESMSPPSPQGWPDRAADWAAPEQVLRRVELAEDMGRLAARDFLADRDPVAWAESVLGPALAAGLRRKVAQAPDRSTACGLVFAAPVFQWR